MEYLENVLWPVESIIEGTWGSGQPPKEFYDFLLMREMHWSWDQLNETPPYVQRYSFDFIQAIFEQERSDADKANRGSNRRASP